MITSKMIEDVTGLDLNTMKPKIKELTTDSPVFNLEAVKEQVCEEIRTIMDTYAGSIPDDIYSELETLEQETIAKIFDACGSYGMRD